MGALQGTSFLNVLPLSRRSLSTLVSSDSPGLCPGGQGFEFIEPATGPAFGRCSLRWSAALSSYIAVSSLIHSSSTLTKCENIVSHTANDDDLIRETFLL